MTDQSLGATAIDLSDADDDITLTLGAVIRESLDSVDGDIVAAVPVLIERRREPSAGSRPCS